MNTMKTADEVLADDSIVRMHREEEERTWMTLVKRCRTPRGQTPFLAQFIMSIALIAVFAFIGHQTGDYRGIYIVAGVFLLICVPVHLWNLRGRDKALFAMIEQEAPQLYRRLKDEKIA
jgi:hypothetical protein